MNLEKISNYMMNIGIILSLYGGYKVYDSRKDLPLGVCPIDSNNEILYLALGISTISIIISTISSLKSKNVRKK